MKTFNFLVIICVFTALLSCSSKHDNYSPSTVSKEQSVVNTGDKPADIDNKNDVKADTSGRKLIKEGTIIFETKDIQAIRNNINKYVKDLNAYVGRETENVFEDRIQNTMLIRVPAENFDKLIQFIASDVGTFESKNIEVKDVTEEFVDIQARMNTRKEVEKTYLSLLKDAKKMDDVLAIQKQIGEIREEIEMNEGKFKYLNDRIAFSSLNLTYYQKSVHKPAFSIKFSTAFRNGWQNLIWFFVGLAYIWPFIIFVIVLVFIIVFITRKNMKKKNKK